jgi:N-acetylglucosamine kinase-like BadF-type ATPase
MRSRRGQTGWRIGVDLGGTWLRVVAFDARDRRREFKGPSPGLDNLPTRLRWLWRRWGTDKADVRALVVAAKGIWTAAERRRQERRLRALAQRIRVISDAEAAHLGALGGRAGMLLLAGTGSMVLGKDASGQWARAGGLGPLLGDEGSAFWIGREWLRATIHGTGFATARRILGSPDPVARIAALAPGVLRRARGGSRRARRITAAAQAALADLLLVAARPLDRRAPVALSWTGGLLADAHFRAGVWRAARRRGVRVKPERPRENPAAAVARMAETLTEPTHRRK